MTDTSTTDKPQAEQAEDAVRFQYTEDDMVAAHMAWWSGSASWQTFLKFAGCIGVFYIGLVYLMNWGAPTPPGQIAGAVLVGLVVTIGGFAIGYVITPRRARKIYREHKALGGEHQVAWDEEAIRTRSQVGANEMPWTIFHCWLDGPQTLLLYQAGNLFHAIPKRALSPAQFADIVGHLRAAGVPEKPRFGFVKSEA
ncbi:YcxB family protein [Methyloligella solikamskensis]|uniref:YcxB family protein n=1 Tax=Methyloligella solikamskensis TaxID=1177756 RepID=A0ABW3J7K9_9HYPH